MNMDEQIKAYIATQPEPKRTDMQELHGIILELMPACTLETIGFSKLERHT